MDDSAADAKQYCRYCGLCCETDDGYWCSAHERLMSESTIKKANRCKEYGYTDVGDVINGGPYHPRKLSSVQKQEVPASYKQFSLFEEE